MSEASERDPSGGESPDEKRATSDRSRRDHPGRDTRTATTRRRGSWYGHGEAASVEKDGVGRFIDDLVYAFADVSMLSIPFLWYVMVTAEVRYVGVKSSTFAAWTVMVVGAAAIRGGWVTPLGTAVPGWVSLSSTLVALRVVYYNLALGVAAYGGGALAATLGAGGASVAFAAVVAVLAVGAFPRLAEEYYRVVSDYVAAWKARPR